MTPSNFEGEAQPIHTNDSPTDASGSSHSFAEEELDPMVGLISLGSHPWGGGIRSCIPETGGPEEVRKPY